MAPATRDSETPPFFFRLLEALYGRVFRLVAALGVPPSFIVTLETTGRRSGRARSVVLILADHEGHRYAVSVLGGSSDWVQNVIATGGQATIRHGRRRRVRLQAVPVGQRAPVLRSYLKWALGARRVLGLGPASPIEEFERIAADHPVFRIERV